MEEAPASDAKDAKDQKDDKKHPEPPVEKLADGEEKLVLIEDVAAPLYNLGDRIMGLWTDGIRYPGSISEVHSDNTFSIAYDDGANARVGPESISPLDESATTSYAHPRSAVAKEKAPKSSSITCLEGSTIEANVPPLASHKLQALFDFQHGRADAKSADASAVKEWKVGARKASAPIKIAVKFSNNYFVTRIRIYSHTEASDGSHSSDFTLFAVPAPDERYTLSEPVRLSDDVVNTSHDSPGFMREYTVNKPLTAVVLELMPRKNSKFAALRAVDIFHKPAEMAKPGQPPQEALFSNSFTYLINNKKFSDCVITVNKTTKIYAHKLVLSSRSAFFRSMFELEEKAQAIGSGEKKDRPCEIDMNDVQTDTFMAVLSFIYSDKVDIKSVDDAVDLWCVADKYSLLALKYQVESYLAANLNPIRAIQVCQAEQLQLFDRLRDLLVSFLAKNFDEAMDLPEFVSIPPPVLHAILKQVKAAKKINKVMLA